MLNKFIFICRCFIGDEISIICNVKFYKTLSKF